MASRRQVRARRWATPTLLTLSLAAGALGVTAPPSAAAPRQNAEGPAYRWSYGSQVHQASNTSPANHVASRTSTHLPEDGWGPSVGDVYHVAVSALLHSGPTDATVDIRTSIGLPRGTELAIDATHPVQCKLTNVNTGIVTDVTDEASYVCPKAPSEMRDDLGHIDLRSRAVRQSESFEIILPVRSTVALQGDAGPNGGDRFVARVGSPTTTLVPTDAFSSQFIETVSPSRPTRSFILAAVEDFLARPATNDEIIEKGDAIEAGTLTRGGYVTELSTSTEWLEVVVQRLYESTLGRPGDPEGVAYWTWILANRTLSVPQVAASFYTSPEYLDRFDGAPSETLEKWIFDLYQEILGRTPDTGGMKYWKQVAEDHGPHTVAFLIFQSPESRAARVTALYEQLLARGPDDAGKAYWAKVIETYGDLALAANLASSDEYYERAGERYP